MEVGKLQQIIANKNERLEREALNEAAGIIEDIAEAQEVIAKAQAKIVELRKRLTALEVQQLDSKALLGE